MRLSFLASFSSGSAVPYNSAISVTTHSNNFSTNVFNTKFADTLDIKKSVNFRGEYKNLIKINPYKMLKNEDSARALEDYIRNGMFIHVPRKGNLKFGDMFWEHFIKMKKQLECLPDSDAVYAYLRKLAENLSSPEELSFAASKQVSERADAIGSTIKNLFKENDIIIKPNCSYLDIGCGNGEVAKAISKEFKLAENNVNGLEIIDRDDFCNIKRFKFDGKNIPKFLAKPNLVTLFNVLHHTKNENEAKSLLKSAYERMQANGVLAIRDHNALLPNDVEYWQVRHLLPIKVSQVDPPCLVQDTVYHSVDEWTQILKDIGFKPKFVKKDKSNGNIYSFYLVVQKPSK